MGTCTGAERARNTDFTRAEVGIGCAQRLLLQLQGVGKQFPGRTLQSLRSEQQDCSSLNFGLSLGLGFVLGVPH